MEPKNIDWLLSRGSELGSDEFHNFDCDVSAGLFNLMLTTARYWPRSFRPNLHLCKPFHYLPRAWSDENWDDHHSVVCMST
jgi:hypothetical protein